ncbi:MAG: hypothetical protein AMDU5_GPLC00003G0143 [Thermoplasmatales archaeon Gpl]|jgi:hypothetical protein|nr:MAG: hypothetical protein AMDU5_GPLC00003G0143 [Thermoplasmatales archaeon Gpl]
MNKKLLIIILIAFTLIVTAVPSTFLSQNSTISHQNNGSYQRISAKQDKIYTSTNGFSAVLSPISAVYEGQHFSMFVNATSGYSNYTATLYLGANYDKGMSPLNSTHESSKSGYFEFNITAPEADNQTIYGSIYLTASFYGTPVNYTSEFHVNVYAPVRLYAEVYNSNYIPYYNVTISFVINGATFKTDTISKLTPYSKEKLNITVSSNVLDYGKVNTLEVKVLNAASYKNGVSVSYSSKFFYGSPPNYSWIYYISGIVIIFMVFLVLSSGRGRGTKQPKWKNRKDKPKKIAKK